MHFESTTLTLFGLLLTAVGALLGGGIAWGAHSARVEQQRQTAERLERSSEKLTTELAATRDELSDLESSVAVMKALLEQLTQRRLSARDA